MRHRYRDQNTIAAVNTQAPEQNVTTAERSVRATTDAQNLPTAPLPNNYPTPTNSSIPEAESATVDRGDQYTTTTLSPSGMSITAFLVRTYILEAIIEI